MTPLKAHSRSHPYPRPAGNHHIRNLARMDPMNYGVRRRLRAPAGGTADTMQDNGELSSQRHPCFAIARSPGDGVPPILQARGFFEPRQNHDSGLVKQSTSECVAAPRYSATAIDVARLMSSQREPKVRAYGS